MSQPIEPEASDNRVVRAAIHPAIGIARVGNSEKEFYIGPEVTEPQPQPQGFYKDSKGALKREAACFRIYGYNASGEVVSELTADNANINWTVHVANKKSAWYQFQLALDIPEAAPESPLKTDPSALRNSEPVEIDGVKRIPTRAELTIDPGPRSISGPNKSGDEYKFDTGKFFKEKVYLGELRTDASGHLIFLGGRGVSASFMGPDVKPTTFANNDGWHDDTSDGPVTAEVSIDGRPVPVDPAWVVVGPPNYAPQIKGGRTMYDLLYHTFVQEGRLPFPQKISFTQDVLPIFQRLNGLQWVNQGYATQFGAGSRFNFSDPDLIASLADNNKDAANTEVRLQIFNMFREYGRDGKSPVPWPWEYGDAMDVPPANTPRQNLAISATQYQILQRWANGDFLADWNPQAQPAPGTLSDVPLSQQPEMLDRAALSFCLADAFHPGCELTWPMRHATLYMSPFRIRHRAPDDPEPNYGSRLTQEMVLKPNGALYGQGPGTLTRWMAVPWQTDTASCRSGYYAGFGPRYDPFVPTFWPARVPNHVLTEESYDVVIDPSQPIEERMKAFRRRAVWLRGLGKDYFAAIASMITNFGKLGVVEVRPGIKNDDYFPEEILVESKPGFTEQAPLLRGLMLLDVSRETMASDESIAIAVAEASEATGHDEDEFVVGPIDKINRFRNTR